MVSNLRAALVLATLLASACRLDASWSVDINDIGSFQGFKTFANEDNGYGAPKSFSGTGFVGVFRTAEINHFGHFFGLSFPGANIATALQVDITDLKSDLESMGKSISSAKLYFDVQGTSQTATVYAKSWDSQGALYGTWYSPDVEVGTINVSPSNPTNSIDVTALLKERVENDADWLGLFLQAVGSGNILSRTDLDSSRPVNVQLVVDYSEVTSATMPEPSALAIWGILGAPFYILRRRLMA